MEATKPILLDDLAASLGVKPKQVKAELKPGKHWFVGRYKKTYLTPAGQAKAKELYGSWAKASDEIHEQLEKVGIDPYAPAVAQDEAIEPELEDVVSEPPAQPEPPKADAGLARLLAESETAVVKHTRFANKRVLLVTHKGSDCICLCKDSRYFTPGMVIPVRYDGATLVSKYQPRRLGKL
jgi:hypothetical protein